MAVKSTDFAYYNILTDSENIVKDISRLLVLGIVSEEIKDSSGTIVKPSSPIVDKCWEIAYPARDKNKFPDIEDWNNLLPDEFKEVTEDQINRIGDTVILKTTTLPKDIERNNSSSIGINKDLNVNQITMYLEIYMPKYLCDSETDNPFAQREGKIPTVVDINGIDSGNTRVARNYHHLFMRIFDHPNEDCSGPADNSVDPSTRDITTWNSRTSNWVKLSWYTDFEEKFIANIKGYNSEGMLQGTIRVPVIDGLTNESKIKIWANINRNRVVLGVMGSPNVDFSDNRYLISCAYVGQIESFDFSVNDTAGNFGIFATSSTSPAMGRTITKIRPSKPAIINLRTNEVTSGSGVIGSGTRLEFKSNLSIFNPGTTYTKQIMELTNIPYDYNQPNGGTLWGDRYVDMSTIRIYTSFSSQPNAVKYINSEENETIKTIGVQSTATFSPAVTYDENDRTKVQISLPIKELLTSLIGKNETTEVLAGSKIQLGTYINEIFTPCTMDMTYNFSYYTEYTVDVVGVTRDKFGNSVSESYDTTYGKNTATGITDFAMYTTFAKDYFQKHFLYFASTEQYMQKELYGKSAYTGEYFADKIKIVHSSEGPRGILGGMITIDTSSLNPFDELVVNKDFEKYKDEPEEIYIFLPVTAPYCPFSNSPNGRHGIGILKELKYPVPTTNEEKVKFALAELQKKYGDMSEVTSDFALIKKSEYGAAIEWTSSAPSVLEIQTEGEMGNAKITRPEFREGASNPLVTLTAKITCGTGDNVITNEFNKDIVIRMLSLTDSKAVVLDLSKIIIPETIDEPQDIELPTAGENKTSISWTSNNIDVISTSGTVVKPAVGEDAVTVILTATCSKGEETETKEFTVLVKPWTEEEELNDAISYIDWDLIKGVNIESQAITNDLVLPTTVGQNVNLLWTADSSNIDVNSGKITRPTYTQGQTTLTLSCKLTAGTHTSTVTLPIFIIAPLPMTNEESISAVKAELESSIFLGDNKSTSNITKDMTLPHTLNESKLSGVNISWSTVDSEGNEITSPYITLIKGTSNTIAVIARPDSTTGNYAVVLKATITSGDKEDSKAFNIVILAEEKVSSEASGGSENTDNKNE